MIKMDIKKIKRIKRIKRIKNIVFKGEKFKSGAMSIDINKPVETSKEGDMLIKFINKLYKSKYKPKIKTKSKNYEDN